MSVITNPATSSTAPPSSTLTSIMDTENDPTRTVRFDDECVLIPQLSRKRQRVVTKSVALPLWKRRSSPASHPASQLSDGESADDPASPVTPTAPEENKHIVIKVPIPSFIVRSPMIGGYPSASPRVQPLSPCLVHRAPSSSVSRPSPVVRRTSLPLYHQQKGNSIITVPLRACCPDCVPITEECLREGEQWEVRFTRGARRRRSASLDHTSPRPNYAGGSDTSIIPSSLARLAITVDEVDKRRRSIEQREDDDSHCESSSSQCSRHPDEPTSSVHSCSSSEYTDNANLAPNVAALLLARSSPIQEEDEDQLFPLPSPRRTPSVSSGSLNIDPSPKPSPLHSRSSSRRPTPAPSPNSSSACVNSLMTKSQIEDTILTTPLTRLNPRREKPIVAELPKRVDNNHTAPPDPHRLSPRPRYPSSPLLSLGSGPSTPSTSPKIPSNSPKERKPSFGLPFLKAADALRGAGADVLKGVSSMAGGAMLG